MKLLIGLGNPAEQYEKTRHNLGFMVLEHFLKDFETVDKTIWDFQNKFKSDVAQIDWQPQKGKLEKVILAKPKTYMNNSGMAASLISFYYKVLPEDIWVIHDDIDLPLGVLKIRFGGASAGHHGVESIIKSLSTDKFWRFRLGIGQTNSKFKIQNSKLRNVEDFVLGNFAGNEKGKVKKIIKRTVSAIETALEDGLEAAMNRFNTR